MKALMSRFRDYCGAKLDISEHLGLLRGLAMDPDVQSIVEIGFRTGISATALATAGKPLTCYDIEPCTASVRTLREMAPNFSFVQGDSLKVPIPKCELLHIDSLHTYAHLLAELRAHANQSSKWIALHDTVTFGDKGKDGSKLGLLDAITVFLKENLATWTLHLHLRNCNGMTILHRASWVR